MLALAFSPPTTARPIVARTLSCVTLLGALAAPMGGCATSGETPAASPRRAAGLEAALRNISAGSQNLQAAVETVMASGDAAAIAEADARLVAIARDLDSEAWLEQKRPSIEAANAKAGLAATAKQLDAQVQLYRDEQHARVLDLMLHVGGRQSLEHCRAVASDTRAAPAVRAAAASVVERFAPGDDTAGLRAEIAAAMAAARATPAPSAAATVATMRPSFKACWDRQLSQEPGLGATSVRIEMKIGPAGEVVDVKISGIAGGALVTCLTGVAKEARFATPEGGGATIVVPIRFE